MLETSPNSPVDGQEKRTRKIPQKVIKLGQEMGCFFFVLLDELVKPDNRRRSEKRGDESDEIKARKGKGGLIFEERLF